jgi:hypothetical protein
MRSKITIKLVDRVESNVHLCEDFAKMRIIATHLNGFL